MSFTWIEPTPLPAGAPALHVDPLVNRILHGVVGSAADAEAFLDPAFQPAPDPFALPSREDAVARVGAAARGGETIAVYGDYDADGVTSTAILLLALEHASGRRPRAWLPDREEGYGLHAAAIRDIADSGATLLIAVDCGSGDDAEVALARSLGLDVVVIDHHQMHGPPPAGAIVVSPRVRPDAPYGELSAAGLAYLFAVALTRAGFDLGRGAGREPVRLLDLAAIGLVGDSSPMIGATRTMVRNGLICLRSSRRPGITALVQAANIEPKRLRSGDIAMRLAPRVNAPGRMDSPALALDLLLAPDDAAARRLMDKVEAHNQSRRGETEAMFAEAVDRIDAEALADGRQVLVVTGDAWRHGVVGLVAGRLARHYDRPVLLLAAVGDELRGSARSVDGFDITAAL
ncbi:MAG TPA: DHH family phosphoesterase, partial [Thermomicrobiales bacterium]|nr:DHH family phosphoesterase [Thermomicrobiales bacterium]